MEEKITIYMILRLLPISLLQSLLLSSGQVFLKYGLTKAGDFAWSSSYFKSLFFNLHFISSGICYGLGSVLWMYIIKHYPFSMAYPMVSISYIIGVFSAIIFFHEQIPMTRWIGVCFILIGCFLVAK